MEVTGGAEGAGVRRTVSQLWFVYQTYPRTSESVNELPTVRCE